MASTEYSYFLSRPCRFGKSLLVTTLEAYFLGRKELFRGLAMEQLEKGWTVYPVLRLDMSQGAYYKLESLHLALNSMLRGYEQEYGIETAGGDIYSDRLRNIILTAFQKTGKKVVVLVDEYDAPMLDAMADDKLLDEVRNVMRDFFRPLKSQSQYLRFVFITGITRFSQMSIFSELNNLNVISMDPEYETICGVSEEELLTAMHPDIENLAEASGQTFEETVRELKRYYDGYHFTKRFKDIYNPFCLIYAFAKREIANYWFSTGTPTMLVSLLQKYDMDLPELEGFITSAERFDVPADRVADPVPMLYQSGYLTLKDYDPEFDEYTLGFPNEEVRRGFAGSLYNYYTEGYIGSRDVIRRAYVKLYKGGSIDEFLKTVQTFYSKMPYTLENKNERHYQALFYALLLSIGADVRAEEPTASGRIDMVLKMPKNIYIFEFKYGKTAEQALQQIVEKDYGVLYADDPRPVVRIGINFSPNTRTITDWIYE